MSPNAKESTFRDLFRTLTSWQFYTLIGSLIVNGSKLLWKFLSAKGRKSFKWSKAYAINFWSYLSQPENKFLKLTLGYCLVWLLFFWIWTSNWISWTWLHWTLLIVFLPSWYFSTVWLLRAFRNKWDLTATLRLGSLVLIPFFQMLTFILDGFTYEAAKIFGGTTFAIVSILWAAWFCWDMTMGSFRLRKNLTIGYTIVWCWLWYLWSTNTALFPELFLFLFFSLSIYLAYCWIDMARHWDDNIRLRAVASVCILPVWQWLVFTTHFLGWGEARAITAGGGLAAVFLVGLGWTVWYVDRRAWELQRARFYSAAEGKSDVDFTGPLSAMSGSAAILQGGDEIWDPFDLDARYYGNGEKKKLNQSLSTIAAYSILFFLLFLILTSLSGCMELYEMPAGGGEQKQVQQVVVQKVIKKKFVINPFSAVLFNPPPIDKVKLQLTELTKHAYTVGYGKGKGAGFSGGTNRGMVRFIRLEYNGGDWDQDFGVGADLNLLLEYHVRTSHKTAKKTESRKVMQLKNFPIGKSPPMVYMTGQGNISLSNKEVEILREYLIDKHGMIFADNGGSGRWHGQFFNVMKRLFPRVRPIKVPLDHEVHQIPYIIPFLPYVAPHGGKDAFGWVVDSRLVAYYHPGDIGDAWADGHAGVTPEISELCYQLGTNVIFYAHAEYNKWLDRQNKKK
ncbi:MAG: DUF4159 domain-containing protein [Opitutae bacterium]|nr:DUF4159 domain-containing protein [Opitutae bacterium]MBT5693170.1 DUF4159 domain-containing protein [Opitutae bacterium]MBT6462954.1 DUF4159 domain-containing protein [Opitutae bacterium]